MNLKFNFVGLLILFSTSLGAQVIADFSLPDTICVNRDVHITNLSMNGSTYYWSFCSGNTALDPIGSEMQGTNGYLSWPAYITVATEGPDCYSFVTNHLNQSVTRFYHGTSFRNDPVGKKNITLPGMITDSAQGIQVKYDNGTWYGFIAVDDKLIRLNFGASLANDPTATSLAFGGVWSLHGLVIVKEGGNHWFGIASSSWGNKVFRLDFGTSLANTPTFTDVTRGFVFNHPGPLSLVQEGTDFYCFVVNSANSSLSRATFGNSLLNPPVWSDLGVMCISDAIGIMLIRDCEKTNGFMSRYVSSGKLKLLFRLLMPQGLTGPASTLSMGNIGNLNKPQQFCEITRVRDTVYTFLCNQTSTTITRLSFVTCSNSSIPSYQSLINDDPPPFSYDSAGIYNVRLTVNEGWPDQQNVCKDIVVVDHPPINLGPDRIMCQGYSGYLDAGANCDTIRWSTGDTTRRIKISQPGTYWVNIHKFGCWGSDTVTLTLHPYFPTKIKPDTTLCQGQKYILNPGSGFTSVHWSTGDSSSTLLINKAGKYWVQTIDSNSCPGTDTVTITMKPAINVNLPPDTTICAKASIVLSAFVPGATYQWKDGSKDSLLTVTEPGVYWVRVSRDSCAVQDTTMVNDCASMIYFPAAFTPNGDGLNDYFHPIGPVLAKFTLTIFNRWGQQVFTTDNQETGWDGTSKGSPCPLGTYSYVATYELSDSSGTSGKVHGTVTLIR